MGHVSGHRHTAGAGPGRAAVRLDRGDSPGSTGSRDWSGDVDQSRSRVQDASGHSIPSSRACR